MAADLKDRLDAQANENKRSLTAEITARLEDTFAYPIVRQSLLAELSYLEGEVERLKKAFDETEERLTRREEELFTERAELRKLKAERTEYARNIQKSEQELQFLKDELAETRNLLQHYVSLSDNLRGLESKIDHVTKALAIYGRAFELSTSDDQSRAMDILNIAIDEVDQLQPGEFPIDEKKTG